MAKLTFAQRMGIEDLPGPMKHGELNERVRARLWSLLHRWVGSVTENRGYGFTDHRVSTDAFTHYRDIRIDLFADDIDEIDDRPHSVRDYLKCLTKEGVFDQVLSFIERLMDWPRVHRGFLEELQTILEETGAAYVFNVTDKVFLARGTDEATGVVADSLDVLAESDFANGRKHLKKASEAIDQGDFKGAARESIHAVESLVKQATGKRQDTLGSALKEFAKKHPLHPALEQAMLKLYGYTSKESGIRHAEIDESEVDLDLALFIYSSCAVFCGFLASKARRAAKQ